MIDFTVHMVSVFWRVLCGCSQDLLGCTNGQWTWKNKICNVQAASTTTV